MRSISSGLMLGACAAALAATAAHAAPYRFHYDHVLGTSLDLTVMATDEASALMATSAATAEIARLDGLLSDWREDAELARLNRADGAMAASPDLIAVLDRCVRWSALTGGAFDCRMGGPLALWREAAVSGGGVQDGALGDALQAARSEVEIDRAAAQVRRPAGVRLTIDGLAKGYVIDAALKAARRASPGVRGVMVDIGGDLRCWGAGPQASGWTVGVAAPGAADSEAPAALLRITDRAVAFSGGGARDLQVQGCAVSPTLSPADGRPVSGVVSAVVLAPSAADADALATAFMVMSPREALALAERLDGVESRLTTADGALLQSAGWSAHEAPVGRAPLVLTALATPAKGGAGDQAAVLDLAYEVPKIEAAPYHAPYVAAWITDADHRLVRTLLLLGQKPKWAPENYVWWRRYGRENPAVLDTVAKPTRPPGRYTARWDGRDEAGHPVAPGRYILHIEASREKGGHTYETADLNLGPQGGAMSLPAKDELGSLEARFGPMR